MWERLRAGCLEGHVIRELSSDVAGGRCTIVLGEPAHSSPPAELGDPGVLQGVCWLSGALL